MSITEKKLIERVKTLPAQQRQEVLDFVEFLHHRRSKRGSSRIASKLRDDREHESVGNAGLQLAAHAWPDDDFSDWPGFHKTTSNGKKRK